MPISEKDIFAALMQDPNHAYNPIEKVWAEAQQRARQFRNNEKALALAFDNSPALEKLFDFMQKARPRNRPFDPQAIPENFEEKLKGNLEAYQEFLQEAHTLNTLYDNWSDYEKQFDPGQQIKMGGNFVSVKHYKDLLVMAEPAFEQLTSLIQQLNDNPALTYAEAIKNHPYGEQLQNFIEQWVRDDGTISKRLKTGLANYKKHEDVEKANSAAQVRQEGGSEADAGQAAAQLIQDRRADKEAMHQRRNTDAASEELEEVEPDTTYDEFHPEGDDVYSFAAIHDVMKDLLSQYGHTEPVSGTDRQGNPVERYYEIVNKNHEYWKNLKQKVKEPDNRIKFSGTGAGSVFNKLKDNGIVSGRPTAGNWEWGDNTEAFQALISNMDRVIHVTTRDGEVVGRTRGELHPALVDWLIDAYKKEKLAPHYTEQDVFAHTNEEVAPGISASPSVNADGSLPDDVQQKDYDDTHVVGSAALSNEELDAIDRADAEENVEEEENVSSEDEASSDEEQTPDFLLYDTPAGPELPTGLIEPEATPATPTWLRTEEQPSPTPEQIEENIENVQNVEHPKARFFPRWEKQYLFPRKDGEDFNPLKVDGKLDGEDASAEDIKKNYQTLLKAFHSMNYKYDEKSLPKIFGEYANYDDPEDFNFDLKPETWDDETKAAYNEMRDNIGIHEGWLQGLLMAGMVPEEDVNDIYNPGVVADRNNETWADKGTILKGQWNWVEALRGLGLLDDAGYPKFAALNHAAHGLDLGAGHGLVFQGGRRSGGRRGTGPGQGTTDRGGSFHEALNELLTAENIATKEQPYWAEAEQERKIKFMEEFGGAPRAAERAWEIWQQSKGIQPGRFAGPEPTEFRPDPEEGTEADSENFHDFTRRILAEGHLGQAPDVVRESIFGGESTPAPAGTAATPTGGSTETGPVTPTEEVEPGQQAMDFGTDDFGTIPGSLPTSEPTDSSVELGPSLASWERAKARQAQERKAKQIDALMDAYPGSEEHKADHRYELENNESFFAAQWAAEIKRRADVGRKADAEAEKEEKEQAKLEAKQGTPLSEQERDKKLNEIKEGHKQLHGGLELDMAHEQLLAAWAQDPKKQEAFLKEHEKIINEVAKKKQGDAKAERERRANNLDGHTGIRPLAELQQPTTDDLIMQIRRIDAWRAQHSTDMSSDSHNKLEQYEREVHQMAANIGFDVDAQRAEDEQDAAQRGLEYGSSDWLKDVGQMHEDEMGRQGKYQRQVAKGGDLRANTNYKPWLVVKYDENGFGTFHDLRQRGADGDWGVPISPESLKFNDDEHYFDYKGEPEDASQHPTAANKFWSKLDRANFRPIDRHGMVERHGERGLVANTTHSILGERGSQTGWYHPESGSWINPHRYREIREQLSQAGPNAGMMILNGSLYSGNHISEERDINPRYAFAHRTDKTVADTGANTGNEFSYYVDGQGNIAHANSDWDSVQKRDTNQIQDVNSVIHDWHSQNMNNMVRQDIGSWQQPDGKALTGRIISSQQAGGQAIQNMELLKEVQEKDALARRRKQPGYTPGQIQEQYGSGLAADELGGMGQYWGKGAEARQKAFDVMDYIGSGVIGWWGEAIMGGKSKTDRAIRRARKQYKLHAEAEKRTKEVMDKITWHGEKVRYLSPGEEAARKEDLQQLRTHLEQQRRKHQNAKAEVSKARILRERETKMESPAHRAKEAHHEAQALSYSNDLTSILGTNHELDSHWNGVINPLYEHHMGGSQVQSALSPHESEGAGAWANIFAQPQQEEGSTAPPPSTGLIGGAPTQSSGTPPSMGLIGGPIENTPTQSSSGVGLIG